MAVQASRVGLYEVHGIDGNAIVARLTMYAVQGGVASLYATRATMYVVEGPPHLGEIVPDPDLDPPSAPSPGGLRRRRALTMS